MPRSAGPIAAGAIAFAIVLVARFPARWAADALPSGVACTHLGGTVWNGSCSALDAAGLRLGAATWQLHPLRLLAGKLSVDVTALPASGEARARLELSPGGSLVATNLHAHFALGGGLIPALPRSLGGSAQAEIRRLRWQDGHVTAIAGQLEVRGLTIGRGEPLGSYELLFPASPASKPGTSSASGSGSEPTGRLTDLGGPFVVEGTVRLTPQPGYVVEGLVAARADAPADLAAQLRYLGAADAEGRRPFSFAGTFE